ncbi:MAG: hypothetical protein RIS44_2173 [Pseudomonadota bacterium]|jgi:hypothetical protein
MMRLARYLNAALLLFVVAVSLFGLVKVFVSPIGMAEKVGSFIGVAVTSFLLALPYFFGWEATKQTTTATVLKKAFISNLTLLAVCGLLAVFGFFFLGAGVVVSAGFWAVPCLITLKAISK